jgi:hypothetical protein
MLEWRSCWTASIYPASVKLSKPTLDTPELWGLMDGESQTDGSALFWSRSDVLVEVSNGRLRLHQLPHIGRMVGAARIGEFLFVAGYTTLAESTESVVLRAKSPVLN